MKVILRTDIDKLGKQGDIKNVSPGHARNYLIPKNLVFEASAQNMKIWEKEKVKLEKKKQEIIAKAAELAEKIEKTSLTISVYVGKEGKLFGSVTNADIAEILIANGFTVDKHDIIIKDPIKEVGVYTLDVKVHPEVIAHPKIWVVEKKEEEGK